MRTRHVAGADKRPGERKKRESTSEDFVSLSSQKRSALFVRVSGEYLKQKELFL